MKHLLELIINDKIAKEKRFFENIELRSVDKRENIVESDYKRDGAGV